MNIEKKFCEIPSFYSPPPLSWVSHFCQVVTIIFKGFS